MLKAWYLNKQKEILKLIEVFLNTYGNEINNLIPHLGVMLLARMDGRSPVNYIVDENMKNTIRRVAINWIQDKTGVTDFLQKIQKAFQTD